MREVIGLRIRRALVFHEAEDLTGSRHGALHDHRVALADVLAGDLVLVVERGVGDDDAANGDGLQPRHGCQCTGASDLDVDLLKNRRRLLGGEFVRQAPRGLRETKPSRCCQSRRFTM